MLAPTRGASLLAGVLTLSKLVGLWWRVPVKLWLGLLSVCCTYVLVGKCWPEVRIVEASSKSSSCKSKLGSKVLNLS